ncbi:MAG TPA: PAS domain S-box protein, partial [Casimicrobiaceae bacterium]
MAKSNAAAAGALVGLALLLLAVLPDGRVAAPPFLALALVLNLATAWRETRTIAASEDSATQQPDQSSDPESGPTVEPSGAALRTELSHWRRVQDDAAANETHFRALVETSGDIVWAADSIGCCTYVNGSAFEAILGYRAEEIIGFPFTHFAMAATAQTFDDEFFKLIDGGAPLHVEGAFLHRNGHSVYLTINAIALRDDEGNFIGASGTAVDVSKLKTAEALLRHALSEQQSIFDSATVGIAIVDDGSILRANAELERMFAFSHGTPTGVQIATLLAADDSENWLLAAARAVATRGVYDCDAVCTRPDGTR